MLRNQWTFGYKAEELIDILNNRLEKYQSELEKVENKLLQLKNEKAKLEKTLSEMDVKLKSSINDDNLDSEIRKLETSRRQFEKTILEIERYLRNFKREDKKRIFKLQIDDLGYFEL